MTSKYKINLTLIKFCFLFIFTLNANSSIYIEREIENPKVEPDAANQPLPELKDDLFPSYDLDQQTGCLAVTIYFEARGESVSGQFAVGRVILNRVTSRKYPNRICDVVYQNAHRKNRCQFSFACDGKIEDPRNENAWLLAMGLAKILVGDSPQIYFVREFLLSMLLNDELIRSTHYHASYVRPGWSKRLERSGQIGQHIFYISQRVWS
ncbi:MAG: cell wall hydrolase [Fimbriimonadaceae bacterium]|nr:cell wall hydrolase [Alphaproteobacteria bacterium]